MSRAIGVIGLLLAGLAGATPLWAQDAGDPFAGDWNGVLRVGAVELRLVLHVDTADGGYTATLDSPDQGAFGIPASSAEVSGDSLIIAVAAIGGRFAGELDETGQKLFGTWSQGGRDFPLELARGPGEEVRRPQEPEGPLPYDVEDVTFASADSGVVLAGTLTRPEGEGPYPAAVLVSGSGPQNRDEELLGHRPFLVLADYLTRRGIAVLRYDDRGVAESSGDFATATSADFATDAEAAVEYLLGRDDMDPAAIGVIGHSEGGLVAQLVAARSEGLAYIVMMAGPGIPGDSLLALQAAAINRVAGMPDETRAAQADIQRQLIALAVSDADAAAVRSEARSLLEAGPSDLPAAQIDAQVEMVSSPWMRWFLRYDPAPILRQVTIPVLAINGSKDLQVLPEPNLSGIEAALTAAGNQDFTIVELEGLNHLFQTAETGLPAEYGRIEQTLAPVALETIGDWIVARFGGT